MDVVGIGFSINTVLSRLPGEFMREHVAVNSSGKKIDLYSIFKHAK